MAEIQGTEFSNLIDASASGGSYLASVSAGAAEFGGSVTTEGYESAMTSADVGVESFVESFSGSAGIASDAVGALSSGEYASFESYGAGIGGAEAASMYGASFSAESASFGGEAGYTEAGSISAFGGGAGALGGGVGALGGGVGALGGGAGLGGGLGDGIGLGPALPLNLYKIQQDSNPAHITRPHPGGVSVYRQNIHIRFLKPPTPPAPGPLIIREVRPPQPRPAPPLIIRQRAPRPRTPPPIVLRERPPVMPIAARTKVVIRRLAALPAPERQVIIERYRALPSKPQDVFIERWIPYGRMPRRKVIVQRAARQAAYKAKKNVIIEYIPAAPRRERIVRRLGIINASPGAYASQHGASLLETNALLAAVRRLGIMENISPPMVVHAAGGYYGGAGFEAIGGGAAAIEGFESASFGGGAAGYNYESASISGGAGGAFGGSLYGGATAFEGSTELGGAVGASSYEYSSVVGGGASEIGESLLSNVAGTELIGGGIEGASSSTVFESSSFSANE